MKPIIFLLLATLFSLSTIATIEGKFCISSIGQGLSLANSIKATENPEVPVVIWDIDDTLLTTKRQFSNETQVFKPIYYPREPETANVVKSLENNGFKEWVITARLQGLSTTHRRGPIMLKVIAETKDSLTKILSMDLDTHGIVANDTENELIRGDNTIIVRGSIAFAGSQYSDNFVKGESAAQLIDQQDPPLLKEAPTHLLVYDDTINQLNNYEITFTPRKEKVYLIHHPVRTGYNPGKCAPSYTVVE